MAKEKILGFIMELVCYEAIIVVLLFIANKIGWTDMPVLETSICITIGWLIWKAIMAAIDRKRQGR